MHRMSHSARGSVTPYKFGAACSWLATLIVVSAGMAQGLVPREQAWAWGDNANGQCDIGYANSPRRVVQVSAGMYHTLALQADGTIVGTPIYNQYGTQNYGQSTGPTGRFKWITAGGFTSAAVAEDGSIVGWGNAGQFWCRPAEGYIEADGSDSESYPSFIARRADGSISSTCFRGYQPVSRIDDYGAYKYISAGWGDTFAIRADGTLWSHSGAWNSRADLSGLAQVAQGYSHIVFLRAADGTIKCEGDNQYGACNAPSGRFVQIQAGGLFSAALDEAGTVVTWGYMVNFRCCNPKQYLPPYLWGAHWSMISAGAGHMAGILTPCYSDLDFNRITDASDLSLALLDFGTCTNCDADLDEDGEVTTADVSLLLLSWGDCI
jgi:hypothetical protein